MTPAIVGASVAGSTAAASFHLEGRGWGHGVGMSQFGAFGRAQAGQTAGQILGFYYQGTQVEARPMPGDLRIWLARAAGADGVVVSAGVQPMAVQSASGVIGVAGPGGALRVSADADGLRLGDVPVPGADRVWIDLDPASPVTVAPGGGPYGRGRLEVVLAPAGALRVIVAGLSMQTYLYGVSEVPSSWPAEALRAKAIAARSYAAEKIARLGPDRPDCSCSLLGTQGDQVYAGMAKETGPYAAAWVNAVDSTDAQVVTYGSAPIQAYYSSSNGGFTAASGDAFAVAVPYLVAQADPFDAASPDSHWVRDYGQADLSRWLAAHADTNVGTLMQVQVLEPRDGSGRVSGVRAPGSGGVLVTGTAGARQVSGQRFEDVVNAGVFGDGGGYRQSIKSTLFSVGP